MRFGLVLGGGGVVGIAWEVGVLAGLARSGALDPRAAAVIVGTSAGSVVGSRLAVGHDVEALVAEQQVAPAPTGAAAGDTGSSDRAPRADMSVVMEIFGELRAAPEVTPDVTKVVGAKAMAAPTPPEDRWIASFETTLGGPGAAWPADRDLRIAALDCNTGERRMWTSADAAIAPLPTAVASSCAVPGMFPTVAIGDSRYTDGGVWSVTNADVLLDDALDAVVVVVPTAGAPAQQGRRPAFEVEAEQLEAAGTRTIRVVPGAAFARDIGLMNLMNPAFRAQGVEIGIADGDAAAESVRSLLSELG
jgi:NTE family protein